MSQSTLVLKIPRDRHDGLRSELARAEFEHRSVPHAVFSVKGGGTVATLYTSGKLVVQGAQPELFLARYTSLDVAAIGSAAGAAEGGTGSSREDADGVERGVLREVTVGSDEAGKGDFFGPLVVAAVRVEPGQSERLLQAGVADSKRLTDARAHTLGAFLRSELPHSIRKYEPADYNRTYERYRSLNQMLADLHAAAIREVALPGVRVLVDQFGHEKLMREALANTQVRLEQAHRAERNVAVAAASILARQEFLVSLAELEARFETGLHKGAGEPVDADGERFVLAHGVDALGEVAKLHFKNRGKLLDRLGGEGWEG